MSIHPTAIISEKAVIGHSVEVGPFAVIHENVTIGDGTKIGSNCELGVASSGPICDPLRIGKNSTIRSHSVFYEGSSFGDGLTTGHRVTVREGTTAGVAFQIGTLGDIQGHCEIGDYVKFHSNVHVGHHTIISDYVWVFPYVVFTNDPTPPSEVQLGCFIGKFAAIATMSVILPGVSVGEGALIGACSAVTKDVGSHRVAVGNPAKDRGDTSKIKLQDGTDRPAYPWKNHFHRGYPREIVVGWLAEISKK